MRLHLETHCRVSNNRGVAKAGSLCMKVARTITQYPIVSSSYCSRTALHSGQRSTMMFSPYLEEEAFLVAFCLDSSSLFLALLLRIKNDTKLSTIHLIILHKINQNMSKL